jgi:hypothetical protein
MKSLSCRHLFSVGVGLAFIFAIFAMTLFLSKMQEREDAQLSTYVVDQIHRCHVSSGENICINALATTLLEQNSLPSILKALEAHEAIDQIFIEKCHALAHYLGQERYRETKSVSAVFSEASPVCLAGAFHGALEGYFSEQRVEDFGALDTGTVTTMVRGICEPRDNFRTPWEYGNCYHGLGHALMFFTENELQLALGFCDAVQTLNEREICYDGAFMENVESVKGVHPSTYLREDDDYYPCEVLDARYQKRCYTYSLPHRFQGDFQKSAAVCRAIPVPYRQECFNRIGIHAVMATVDPKEISAHCNSINEAPYQKECVTGAAISLSTRLGSHSPLPYALCALVEPVYAAECYRTIAYGLASRLTNGQGRQEVCRHIPEDLKERCLAGSL